MNDKSMKLIKKYNTFWNTKMFNQVPTWKPLTFLDISISETFYIKFKTNIQAQKMCENS